MVTIDTSWFSWAGPKARRHKPKLTILASALCLVLIGLTVQYVIGPALALQKGSGLGEQYFFVRHVVSTFIGLGALFAAWFIPIKTWIRLSPFLAIAALMMSLVTILLDGPGARWIQLGFFSFQPVEVLKIASILLVGV